MKFAVNFGTAIFLSWSSLSAQTALRLDLKDAVALAVRPESQARLQTPSAERELAAAAVSRARSATALMIEGNVSESVVRFDLRALGIDFPQVSPFVANVTLPAVVGPFSVIDGRIVAGKSLFDRGAAGQVRAAIAGEEAAKTSQTKVREQIAAETAKAYFAAALAQATVELEASKVKEAQRLVAFETERKAKGFVTGAEIRRANAGVYAAEQKLAAARSEHIAAILKLTDLLGIDFGQTLELTPPDALAKPSGLEEALATALRSRAELIRSERQIHALDLTAKAIDAQKLPTLGAFGNIGALSTAPTPNRTESTSVSYTYAAGLAMRVPILDGGRRAGQLADVEAKRRDVDASARQMRRQVELEVRLAFERVRAADEQIALISKQLSLVREDLQQTKGRFDAGETTVLEVSDAQLRVEDVQHEHLKAIYERNLARLAVAEAMGTVSEMNW